MKDVMKEVVFCVSKYYINISMDLWVEFGCGFRVEILGMLFNEFSFFFEV